MRHKIRPSGQKRGKLQSENLASNHITIEVLQRLFFSESKPRHLLPIDLAILAYLILRRTSDHEISDSQQTLADRVCGDRKTVARSLRRLGRLGWVSVSGRGRGRTKGLSIDIDKLPAAQPVREKISKEAKQFAYQYEAYLKKTTKRRFAKNWLTRQGPSAQQILTKCGGNLPLAGAVVEHAFDNPKFKKCAETSLYHLLCKWRAIKESFDLAQAVKQAQQQPQAQIGGPNDNKCNPAA